MKIGLAATRLMFRSETVSQEGFPDGPVSSRPSIRSKSSAASARAASRSSGAKSSSSARLRPGLGRYQRPAQALAQQAQLKALFRLGQPADALPGVLHRAEAEEVLHEHAVTAQERV